LPVGFDANALMNDIEAEVKRPTGQQASRPTGQQVNRPTWTLEFRGYERAWRGDRTNALARSFLAGLRSHDPSAQLGFVLKTGTSDMNVVAPIWKCPTIAYGPGDSSLDHTPNEHLRLDEYWNAVNVLEQVLRAYAGLSA
jgi:LysW-gamma-L-lysine carboxypeptidase